MTLKEFTAYWLNKRCDYDGRYGNQCVDLFRKYCADVLHIPHCGGVEGAKDLFNKFSTLHNEDHYLRDYFVKEDNAARATVGDIIVWTTGTYGHVAIVTEIDATKSSLTVFEQDGFNQKKGCYFKQYSITSRMGLLIPRSKNV